MSSVIDSKTAFGTLAFSSYENAASLTSEERYLIDKYLDKAGKTLEAGTGGGRILLELNSLGFNALYGFDYIPGLIEAAKRRDPSGRIRFEVQDATCLTYDDGCFDQILYLAQIVSTIEEESARLRALREAYRILKTGGRALFSFLSFDARTRSALHAPYLAYLKSVRLLLRSKRAPQSLPWLTPGGKFNFAALADVGPHFYWYKLQEASDALQDIGFRVVAIGSSHQVIAGRMADSYELCLNEPINGMLYCVATK
jgi:SAM-dependent methyltransferase